MNPLKLPPKSNRWERVCFYLVFGTIVLVAFTSMFSLFREAILVLTYHR